MSAQWISFEVAPSGRAALATVATVTHSARGIEGGWPFPSPSRRATDAADPEQAACHARDADDDQGAQRRGDGGPG